MVTTKEKTIVCFIFGCCACTSKIKLNTYWLMDISSKIVCIVNRIASITALYWVDNFRPHKKHLYLLASLVTKNILLSYGWEKFRGTESCQSLSYCQTNAGIGLPRPCSEPCKKMVIEELFALFIGQVFALFVGWVLFY